MRAKFVNEFHKTGDPLRSLDIGVSKKVKAVIKHRQLIEDALKDMFMDKRFRDIVGNDSPDEIKLNKFDNIEKFDNTVYTRTEFTINKKTYHLGWNTNYEYYVGLGTMYGDIFFLDYQIDGYDTIEQATNNLLYWIIQNHQEDSIKESLNEFHKTGDPLGSLNLGIASQRTFSSFDELVEWIRMFPNVVTDGKLKKWEDYMSVYGYFTNTYLHPLAQMKLDVVRWIKNNIFLDNYKIGLKDAKNAYEEAIQKINI